MSEENDWVDGALDKNLFKMTTAKVKKAHVYYATIHGGGRNLHSPLCKRNTIIN